MKTCNPVLSLCTVLFCTLLFIACSKEQKMAKQEEISSDLLDKIKAKGFSTHKVQKVSDGYIVEGDILLTTKDLEDTSGLRLRAPNGEQYRTTNLVSGLPRVITINISGLPTVYTTGLDEAIARYNAEGLRLTFSRVSGAADISVSGFYQGPDINGNIILGSAGFPTGGNPHNSITMNTHPQAYGSSPDWQYIASVLQHEIGHCIGLRHTDYATRSSCHWSMQGNEGAGSVGAIHLPGTPTGDDSNSWMVACSNGGNRTFNSNDREALVFLYGQPPVLQDGRYVRDGENGTIYFVMEGTLRSVGDMNTYLNFFWQDEYAILDHQQYRTSTLALLPQGDPVILPFVAIIKSDIAPEVYFAEKYTNGVRKTKRPFADWWTYLKYFQPGQITTVSQAEVDAYPLGTTLY